VDNYEGYTPPANFWDPTQVDDITRKKHGGNRESEAAHTKNRGSLDALRKWVEDAYLAAGLTGMTADQAVLLWEERTGTKDQKNAIAPRVSELLKSGVLCRTGQKRQTRHGNRASVVFHLSYIAVPRIDDRLKPFTNDPEVV